MAEKECIEFLEKFVPMLARKSKQANQLLWILETTGSEDAADLHAQLHTEYKTMLSDPELYAKIQAWQKEVSDPIVLRQLKVLSLQIQECLLPEQMIQDIAEKEAKLTQTYASFRPDFEGKKVSENQILDFLKKEQDPTRKKEIWKTSKQIGSLLAPQILELTKQRNLAAKHLGYSDYFSMQLKLQEIDPDWLFPFLEDLFKKSEPAYQKLTDDIQTHLSEKFSLPKDQVGAWAWNDPFCQEDPFEVTQIDDLIEKIDIVASSKKFFTQMGFQVDDVLQNSDLFERSGKNQHAFCINIDRSSDIRTLNNIQPKIRWLDTVLHELGHAVYEQHMQKDLPWLLREPPHMITTEAMALLCGRQAYSPEFLKDALPGEDDKLIEQAYKSSQRRQLIFCRWALLMTFFERELYANPDQDLNKLWWDLVKQYQKIEPKIDRVGAQDWAAKYHIGLAPVYYYSYILGELFASSLSQQISNENSLFCCHGAGSFLKDKVFAPGNSYPWDELITKALGNPLTSKAWLEQFAQ